MKDIHNNQSEGQISPYLVMVIRTAFLLIPKLNTQVLPIAFTVECGVAGTFHNIVHSHLDMCLQGFYSFIHN